MTVGDMADYLARFNPDEDLPITVVNLRKRIRYPVRNICFIEEEAFIGVEIDGGEPFGEELIRAALEDERNAESQEIRLPPRSTRDSRPE